MASRDVIFLIPGFLGFERFEEFAYFGDRVATALRAALTRQLGRAVTVVPVPIPPTASLADRQFVLGRTLVRRARAILGNRSAGVGIHLLGHSTGGVDAQLLTVGQALANRSWNDFGGEDVSWLRERLRSVTSIASPHQGTCLASDPIARWFASDSLLTSLQRAPAAVGRVLPAVAPLASSIFGLVMDPDVKLLLRGLLASEEALHFLWNLLGSRDLVDDLTPEKSVERYSRLGKGLELRRRSFVTLAGLTPTEGVNSAQTAKARRSEWRAAAPPLTDATLAPPDSLFLLLAQLTSGRESGPARSAPLLPGSLENIQAALGDDGRVIAASRELLPVKLDAAVNDGVVNSARQLIDPSDPDELAAVVVGDHFDVVGHYDRSVWISDPKTGDESERTQLAGLLHSGSRFRDDQFFALMERVVDAMLPAFAS